ncbi:glycosyltransferase family 4 protein [Gillisia sp. Q332]|uniref:glycosyltransferase family 4 protein n=1 Tax=Gillisia xinjiangensis TaxID=3384765 RepID=UPI00391CEF32
MTILHLSAVKNWGGGEKHIENLCVELGFLDPEIVNIIFCPHNSQFQKHLKKTGFKVIPAHLDFKMDPRYFLKLVKICRKQKIDLIHIHDSTALTLAIMGDHLGDLPPFIFSKKTSFPIQARKSSLYKYNYPKLKKILCVSEKTKAVSEENISEHEKLQCIYHGTSLRDKATENAFSIKDHLKLNKNTLIIGNIANHIWPKDLKIFIRVAEELVNNQKVKNIHFVQIGAFSELTSSFKKLIKDLKLEDHISLLNKIEDASRFIPQFDISLMTSESEGIPQFIYESFYHKVPVVSTDVGGIPEVIQHGENGLLAQAFDFMQLAGHIVTLQNNSALREQFTSISKEKLHQSFTSGIMAQKTLIEYKNVLNGRF